MSDWRSGNNKDGGRKERPAKSKPVSPVTPNVSSPSPPGPTTDWRGSSKKRVIANKPQDKSWTGRGREKTASTSALAKAVLLGGLGLIIASLFYMYWVFVWVRDPRLPIVVSIASDYSSLDLGSNSFGPQAYDLKQEKLQLFPASKKLASGEPLKLISNETFLNEIKVNDEWGKRGAGWDGIDNYMKGKSLAGGGPSSSVTAYFISCLIAREKAPGVKLGIVGNPLETDNSAPWVLLTKDDDPFGNSAKETINIKKFLERIANQTAEGTYAFVVMDVKPPTVVANLGDLEFPQKAFADAFNEVKDNLKDRLIVCLPCDEGEENWIAPEFSSSVFAHFFWQGVSTGLEKSRKKWSILEFQNSLKEKVSNWVARFRYAVQTPTFLMSKKTESRIKDVLFVETSGGELEAQSGTKLKDVLQSRYKSLEGLWDNYALLQHCLITNPLRFATIESGLIHMEDLAECASESAWNTFETRIKEHFAKLQDEAKFDRRVSLVEAEKHNAFFSGSSVFSDQADGNCLKVWSRLLRVAESDDKQGWAKEFSKAELQRAIDECKLDAKRTPVEWIEIRLLKLIHEAIGDIAENPKAHEAIAGLIRTYSDLNKIAFEPRLELSRWTRKRVLAMDQLFAECFDNFFSNDFDACLEKRKTMQTAYIALSAEFDSLKAAMKTRDEVFWLTPHLLASQMRMSRQPDAKENESMTDIANLLQDAISIRDSLVDAQVNPATLSLRPEAAQKLEDLKSRLIKAFADFAERPAESGTLSMTRTALRWPLLPKELRIKLHSQLVKLYEMKKESSEISGAIQKEMSLSTEPTGRKRPSSVGATFLSNLRLQGNNLETIGRLYERMVSNDGRYSIPEIESEKDNKDSLAPIKLVYRESYETRAIANSFGQRVMAERPNSVQWPWNAPDQLQTVNEVVYNHVQSERLCVSRWGDGDLSAPNDLLYFQRLLAEKGKYSKPFNASPRLALKDFTQSNSISATLETSSQEFVEKAVAEVKRLGVNVSPFELDQESPVSLTLAQNDWNALGTLSVHTDSRPEGRIPFLESAKTNSKGLPLSKSAGQGESIQKLKLSPKLVGNQLRLGVRGHFRESPLRQADAVQTFRLDLKRPLGPATVRVEAKDNEAITMWVLLDCSNSMKQNNIHAEAKATAGQLLRQVMQLNDEGESPLHVGFMVFGRRPDADTPDILKQCTIGSQIFKSAVMRDEQIGQLIDLAESSWVRPSGCTPLYDAIYTACEESKNDGRNWIVVISDGSNDVDLLPPGEKDDGTYYYPLKGNKKVGEVKQKVLETKSSLFVYQYSNDAYYREAKNLDGTQKFLDSDIKRIERDTQELRNLLNEVSPKIEGSFKSKMLYSTFDELSKDLIALLPVSSIVIADPNGRPMGEEPIEKHRFGKQITVNVTEPTQATVTVTSHGKISKPLPIWLNGGEKLEFKYSDTRGLTMIPYKDDLTGFRKSATPMAAEGGGKFKVAVKATTAATAADRLDLQLSLQGAVAETVEQTTFTRRPSFVVASIAPAGATANQAFWLCDHSFRSNTHYPLVQLPYIPWQEENRWRSDEIDLRVWMSDDVPKSAVKISMKPGDQEDLKEPKLRLVRTDSQVTVTAPESVDRHLIMCSSAIKTRREYSEGRETKIIFDVPSKQAAEICIVKISELPVWTSDGTLQHYTISGLKFGQ